MPIEDCSDLNLGAHVTSKTNRTQTIFVPNPYTTKYGNQLSDAYANAQPCLLSSDENHTRRSGEAESHGIVRKRSGEIVKSSLKNGRPRERARSLPSIPTSFKEVHFDAQLERVRHFFHSERPAAISKEGSPADEYPAANFSWFPDIGAKLRIEHVPFSSSLESPVYMEAIHLSSEGSMLVGQILVKNIAYHKNVAVRFTFDNWHTISETKAFHETRFNDETNPKDPTYDRFTFHIKLRDFINDSSTFYFCVRYNVANQEFWDNNSGNNYRVNFTKRHSEPEYLKRTKSCPASLNTETCSLTPDSFLDLFNEHMETMADLDDTELWAASFKRHAMQGPVYKNLK